MSRVRRILRTALGGPDPEIPDAGVRLDAGPSVHRPESSEDVASAVARLVRDELAASWVRIFFGPRDGVLQEYGRNDGDGGPEPLEPGSAPHERLHDPPAARRGADEPALRPLGAAAWARLDTGSHVGAIVLGPPGDDGYERSALDALDELGSVVGLALTLTTLREETPEEPEAPLSVPAPIGLDPGSAGSDTDAVSGIVGQSPGILALIEQVRRVAPTDAAVMVRGETGTGKERVVEALHALSRRAEAPLVKVPSAAIPETLLESELFGHEPGAFTGATDSRPGRFEAADGGTLFFDDVDTLPVGVQAKLLRALQEGEVQRLGSNTVIHVDVRIIAATNRDLLADVEAGRFREDLYYRLNVVPLDIPPLRDRPEDIRLLVEHFLRLDGRVLGREVREISATTLAELEGRSWPGNVRELRNVVQRALALGAGPTLELAGEVAPGTASASASAEVPELGTAPLAELLKRYKTRLVREALERSDGNQRRASEILGIHRPSLTRMLRDLDLRTDRRRS